MAHDIEYGTTGKPHPYHLVRPSIWPFFGAIAGGLAAMGMVLFMHDTKIGGFSVGFKGLSLASFAFWALCSFGGRTLFLKQSKSAFTTLSRIRPALWHGVVYRL